MTMMPFHSLVVAAGLLSGPLPIVAADTAPPISCLSADEMREVVSDGRVMQPAAASRHAREAAPGEVLRIRLCRQGEEFVYVVTTMRRNGRVARVTIGGHSGTVSDIR